MDIDGDRKRRSRVPRERSGDDKLHDLWSGRSLGSITAFKINIIHDDASGVGIWEEQPNKEVSDARSNSLCIFFSSGQKSEVRSQDVREI